jgi:HlyD family secretion protein
MSLTPASRFRIKPRWLLFAGAGLLIAVVAAFLLFGKKKDEEPYRFGAVERGDITRTVSASGTLEALVTVQVGSQLSGQVRQVLVDFNDRVVRGQLLAVLDPSTYESRLAQGRAEVSAQAAAVGTQQAQLGEAEAALRTQQAAYNRTRILYDKGFQSKAALDTAAAALAQAQASVKSARSGIAAQSARVNQSQASLNATRIDLARTRIIAPIDGVVIDRQIEPGQTVAASLSAPTLFVIAQDLSRVQAKIMVDEADIGQVKEGQRVKFTVDAFPDETFNGVVTQVRKQPQSEQNVVAYVVLAQAENPRGNLLPGMTANADIVIEELKGVLKVPSAALRFTPADAQPQQARGGGQGGFGGGGFGGGGGRQGGGQGQRGGFGARMLESLDLDKTQQARAEALLQEARQKAQGASGAERRTAMREAMNAAYDKLKPMLRPDQQAKLEALRARTAGGGKRGVVWILGKDGKPKAVSVRLGASDGSSTQIFSRELKVGDQVIVGGGPRPKAKAQSGGPLGAVTGGQRQGGGGGGRRGGF